MSKNIRCGKRKKNEPEEGVEQRAEDVDLKELGFDVDDRFVATATVDEDPATLGDRHAGGGSGPEQDDVYVPRSDRDLDRPEADPDRGSVLSGGPVSGVSRKVRYRVDLLKKLEKRGGIFALVAAMLSALPAFRQVFRAALLLRVRASYSWRKLNPAALGKSLMAFVRVLLECQIKDSVEIFGSRRRSVTTFPVYLIRAMAMERLKDETEPPRPVSLRLESAESIARRVALTWCREEPLCKGAGELRLVVDGAEDTAYMQVRHKHAGQESFRTTQMTPQADQFRVTLQVPAGCEVIYFIEAVRFNRKALQVSAVVGSRDAPLRRVADPCKGQRLLRTMCIPDADPLRSAQQHQEQEIASSIYEELRGRTSSCVPGFGAEDFPEVSIRENYLSEIMQRACRQFCWQQVCGLGEAGELAQTYLDTSWAQSMVQEALPATEAPAFKGVKFKKISELQRKGKLLFPDQISPPKRALVLSCILGCKQLGLTCPLKAVPRVHQELQGPVARLDAHLRSGLVGTRGLARRLEALEAEARYAIIGQRLTGKAPAEVYVELLAEAMPQCGPEVIARIQDRLAAVHGSFPWDFLANLGQISKLVRYEITPWLQAVRKASADAIRSLRHVTRSVACGRVTGCDQELLRRQQCTRLPSWFLNPIRRVYILVDDLMFFVFSRHSDGGLRQGQRFLRDCSLEIEEEFRKQGLGQADAQTLMLQLFSREPEAIPLLAWEEVSGAFASLKESLQRQVPGLVARWVELCFGAMRKFLFSSKQGPRIPNMGLKDQEGLLRFNEIKFVSHEELLDKGVELSTDRKIVRNHNGARLHE